MRIQLTLEGNRLTMENNLESYKIRFKQLIDECCENCKYILGEKLLEDVPLQDQVFKYYHYTMIRFIIDETLKFIDGSDNVKMNKINSLISFLNDTKPCFIKRGIGRKAKRVMVENLEPIPNDTFAIISMDFKEKLKVNAELILQNFLELFLYIGIGIEDLYRSKVFDICPDLGISLEDMFNYTKKHCTIKEILESLDEVLIIVFDSKACRAGYGDVNGINYRLNHILKNLEQDINRSDINFLNSI